MPVFSEFCGVVILMYYFDNRMHQHPHIHVQYSGEEAVVSIPQGDVIEGSIRSNKLKLVAGLGRDSTRRFDEGLGSL